MPGNDIQMMSKAMVSVGMISYTGMTGTAFRVGTKYVMTAAHIVRDIVGKKNPLDHYINRPMHYTAILRCKIGKFITKTCLCYMQQFLNVVKKLYGRLRECHNKKRSPSQEPEGRGNLSKQKPHKNDNYLKKKDGNFSYVCSKI